MAAGLYGQAGYHAAALVDRGYFKDSATVQIRRQLRRDVVALVIIQIKDYVKQRLVQVKQAF